MLSRLYDDLLFIIANQDYPEFDSLKGVIPSPSDKASEGLPFATILYANSGYYKYEKVL